MPESSMAAPRNVVARPQPAAPDACLAAVQAAAAGGRTGSEAAAPACASVLLIR